MSSPNVPDGFDHLLYLRVFEGCNLLCKHCFIPHNPKQLSQEQIAQAPGLLAEKTGLRPGQMIFVQWHGGEPTALGLDFLTQAVEGFDQAAERLGLRARHGIQTNLINYDSSWDVLYRSKFAGEVGVSYDPLIREMRTGPAETRNARFEEIFWPKLRALSASGLSPYLVATATKTLFQAYPDPTVFFNKLIAHGVKKTHLERVTPTGYARENWEQIGLDNLAYEQGMSRWLRAYIAFRQTRTKIDFSLSPFDGLLQSVARLQRGETGGYGCWSGTCDSRFHTIDAQGYKRGCTAITADQGNKAASQKVFWFSKSADGDSLSRERAKRQESCQTCRFLPICSSGCMAVEKWDGSGTCSGAQGLFTAADLLLQSPFARGIANAVPLEVA